VHHRARRRPARAGGRRRRRQPVADRPRRSGPIRHPAADPGYQRAARHGVDRGRHGAPGRGGRDGRPFAAPQTPFNASITAHRNVAFAELDFEDIKTVKNHFGVKVNDVVMALVSGVLRQFLIDRGELPDSSLVAMVPVSVHDRSDRPGRNQVSGMFSRLETQIDDPAERLEAIAEANDAAKEHSTAIGATLLQTGASSPGRRSRRGDAVYASSWLTESRPVHNLVVSNVPGPQIPLYWAPKSPRCTPSGRSSTAPGSTSP
jgi:WS/DGAT/MGAT family acyltransferase